MSHFKELVVWQKSMQLVKQIYLATEHFPSKEIYGLTSQLRRAAISVPSNIAEGQARYSKPDFRHFLLIAKGSLAEIETQLLLANDLGYLKE
jgi:four helix bundle protein